MHSASSSCLRLFFARKLWRMNLFTMADFYRQIYGPAAELTGGLIQVPSYFAWIVLQYSALAGVLELYFGIPSRWAGLGRARRAEVRAVRRDV